jgi:hypothetical protein
VLAAICDAASPPALWLESEMREARNGPARLLGRAGSLDRIGPRFTLRPVTAHMCCSAPRKHKTDRLVERGENRNSSRFLAPLRLRRRPPRAAAVADEMGIKVGAGGPFFLSLGFLGCSRLVANQLMALLRSRLRCV